MLYLLAALVVLGVLIAFIYNNLIKLRNKVEEAWSDIDTQLTRRYDLIPNLIETVKGYAGHEQETFQKVTEARNMGMNAKTPQEKEQAENMLTGALKTIFALAENYPELKANENFMQLQTTLKEIEEHIQMSRRYYNGTVRDFNTQIQIFPNNLLAGALGFKEREFFMATEEEKKNIKVDFSEKSPKTPPEAPASPETPTPTPTQEPPVTPQNPQPPIAPTQAKTPEGTPEETTPPPKPPSQTPPAAQ